MDLPLISLSNPAVGFSILNLNFIAPDAKLGPPMAMPARMAPAQSAARIGHIISIESVIFVLRKFIKPSWLAKTPIWHDIPCLICIMNHRIRLGANKATVVTRTRIDTADIISWLCGTLPSSLAFDNRFGVGCSVFSAAGLSAILCTCHFRFLILDT